MNAPFYKFGLFGDPLSLVVAFLIGTAFGFFLERAGFGSARKLAAQFYLTDLTVFKVMFTAIVTAMVGIFYLAWMGVVDLALVYLGNTYILPQTIGGLILGIGFVVGGYCPGTSCVAGATGRIDAFFYLGGIIVGIVVFGELYGLLKAFYTATPMGAVTLPGLLDLPYGLVVLAVILMAIGGFAGATWIERTMARRKEAA